MNLIMKILPSSILILSILLLTGLSTANAGVVSKINSSCSERLITIPNDYSAFEKEVIDWIGNCVKSKSKKNGKPVRRELALVKNNASLASTWNRVNNMPGVQVGISAKFIGKNKVRKIIFSPRGYDSAPLEFENEVIAVDTLLKKRWPKRKKDIKKGKKVLKSLLNIPKKNARKIASMPENPVGTPGQSEVVGIVLNPSPRKLAKYTVGSLIDVLTANQAGEVSKTRRKLYQSYSNGVARALDDDYPVYNKGISKVELEFYKLGLRKTKKLKPIKKHQLRMRLIETYRTYGLAGYHASVNPEIREFQKDHSGSIFQLSMMNHFSKSDFRYK